MGIKVELQDARTLQYCSRGVREFCEEKGISWEDFIKNGIDSDVLRMYDDAMAVKLIEQAEKRHASQE